MSQPKASKADLIVRGDRMVLPDGERAADLVVRGGRIAEVLAKGAGPSAVRVIEAGRKAVLPALVDVHVHVNEPGRTEWEGFETATQAAAAGGIGTIVEMPLNSDPVTTTLEALKLKLEAAKGKTWVNTAFWGGVVPGNASELEPMLDAGALGFKAFLCHSGIDDFPASDAKTLREAMKILARRGAPLLAHAELAHGEAVGETTRYSDYLSSRPPSWEESAIQLLLDLCRETGCRTHIVHLSAASALPLLRQARKERLPLTAETCPHYLTLEAELVPPGRTEFKCAPPIRGRENREALWGGLKEGLIDFIVSDHSPCLPELKLLEKGDFAGAWGGISSLQLGLPVVWTEASARGFGLADLARWMSQHTARFAGLDSKGAIAPGKDADLALFDPEARWTVREGDLRHRHKITPYLGRSMTGKVEGLLLAGREIDGAAPRGTLLLNSDRRLAAK